jgi:hypothetical protein
MDALSPVVRASFSVGESPPGVQRQHTLHVADGWILSVATLHGCPAMYRFNSSSKVPAIPVRIEVSYACVQCIDIDISHACIFGGFFFVFYAGVFFSSVKAQVFGFFFHRKKNAVRSASGSTVPLHFCTWDYRTPGKTAAVCPAERTAGQLSGWARPVNFAIAVLA